MIRERRWRAARDQGAAVEHTESLWQVGVMVAGARAHAAGIAAATHIVTDNMAMDGIATLDGGCVATLSQCTTTTLVAVPAPTDAAEGHQQRQAERKDRA